MPATAVADVCTEIMSHCSHLLLFLVCHPMYLLHVHVANDTALFVCSVLHCCCCYNCYCCNDRFDGSNTDAAQDTYTTDSYNNTTEPIDLDLQH
jgi:hypothetical protein